MDKQHELSEMRRCNDDLCADNDALARRLSAVENSNVELESQLLSKQIELDKLGAKMQVIFFSDATLLHK